VKISAQRSFVACVVNGLGDLETSVVIDQNGFVEGLWLVKLHTVLCAHLICVRIFLSAPVGAIPVLSIRRVA
jgi:hypothetical protein